MKQRTISRWIHIISGIPIIGYIYSPFDKIPQYAHYVRLYYVPMIILTGLWMWKGHVVLRLIRKRPAKQDAAENVTSTSTAAWTASISQH
jgi:cytoskeletal protein RodZ